MTDCLLSQCRKAAGSNTNVGDPSKEGLKNREGSEEESISNKDTTSSEENVSSSSSSLVPKLVVFGGSGCEHAWDWSLLMN